MLLGEAFLDSQLDAGVSKKFKDELDVVEVVLGVVGKYDNVIEVHQAGALPDSGQDDVKGIPQREGHAGVPVCTGFARKRRNVLVSWSDGDLPVPQMTSRVINTDASPRPSMQSSIPDREYMYGIAEAFRRWMST